MQIPEDFEDEVLLGCTRPPMVLDSVPLVPLLVAVSIIAMAAVLTNVLVNLVLVPVYFILAQVTRTDDQAFRQIALWIYCRLFVGRSNKSLSNRRN